MVIYFTKYKFNKFSFVVYFHRCKNILQRHYFLYPKQHFIDKPFLNIYFYHDLDVTWLKLSTVTLKSLRKENQ